VTSDAPLLSDSETLDAAQSQFVVVRQPNSGLQQTPPSLTLGLRS